MFALSFPVISSEAATKRKSTAPQPNNKYASIVIDAATGHVFSSTNPDKQLHPASLTKMMTLLLVFDAMEQGRIKTTDYIRVSSHAADQPPSKLGVRAGGTIKIEDAIRSVAVKSANDMAVALGEAISGNESRFAQKMTERARSIGMTHTRFVNASGLHSQFQVSTARDMATLGRYIIQKYPAYYKYYTLRSFTYAGRSNPSHNKLMSSYAGMDGMKTGYISQSGFNLVASAKRDDKRLIGVVFGGRTSASRNEEMAKLLDAAFKKSFPKTTPQPILVDAKGEATTPLLGAPQPLPTPSVPGELSPVREVEDTAAPTVPPRKPIKTPAKGVIISPPGNPAPQSLGTLPKNDPSGLWSVQIGAYQSREATDRALYIATQKLPSDLSHASPTVAPIKSLESGWLFRARLGNLSEQEARRACTLFQGCLVLAPERY